MALFGNLTSTEDGSNETQKFFIDDDEETLTLLLAGSKQEQILSTEVVESFARRFQDEHFPENGDSNSHQLIAWEGWTTRVTSMGFSVDYSRNCGVVSTSSLASDAMPAAFRSPEGQLHLDATSNILCVSQSQAVQLTLAAMRSVNDSVSIMESLNESSSTSLHDLLGTRSLLEKVMEHCYKQRLARISLIAEFLRLEQEYKEDDNYTTSSQVVTLLDNLDQMWKESGKNRGLFRILLTVCCQPESSLSWNNFRVAKNLEGFTAPNVLNGFSGDSPEQVAWKQFVRDAMNRQRWYSQRERLEALEALLVLLYNRLVEGVSRSDFAILIAAFDSQNFFKPKPNEAFTALSLDIEVSQRLPCLTGLLFVESMTLWRAIDSPADEHENNWVAAHPLFSGNSISVVEKEILTLASFLDSTCSEKGFDVLPESLALLAYGLLLYATGMNGAINNSWSVVSNRGMELAMRANNEYDTFTYFYKIMEKLVISVPQRNEIMESAVVRDYHLPWGLEEDLIEMKRYECADLELSAPSLAYASIGRELLTTTIFAFQSKLIPENRIPDRENIKMLSNLVSVIFQNSPSICGRFWVDWESYCHSHVSSPLCSLVKASHDLASIELRSGSSDEGSMLSVVPFLQIVASLTYSADIAEFVLVSIIPTGLIRHTLSVLALRSATMNQFEIYVNCREKIIDSVCSLARVGNSASCRNYLRSSINENNSTGLKNLVQIVLSLPPDDTMSTTKIFTLMFNLTMDAPLGWVHDALRNFKLIQDRVGFWQTLFRRDNNATQAIVKLVNGFVSRTNNVIFGSSVTENDAIEILGIIRLSVENANNLLLASSSTTSFRLIGGKPLSYSSAAVILECIANTMNCLRPIIQFHESQLIQDTAMEFRDSLLNTLATRKGLGEVVFSFAVAPVSLNIANNIESFTQDSDVLCLLMGEHTKHSESILHQQVPSSSAVDSKIIPSIVSKILSNTSFSDFDFEAVRSRGWLNENDDADSCLSAAYYALRLLNCWAKCVDIKVKSKESEESLDELRLLSPCIYLGIPATWPGEISHILSAVYLPILSLLGVYLCMARDRDVRFEPLITLEVFKLLSSCFAHEMVSMGTQVGILDDYVFRTVHTSNCFVESVRNCVADALTTDLPESPSRVAKLNTDIAICCVRAVASYLQANPFLAARRLALNDGFWADVLSTALKNTSSTLQSIKQKKSEKKSPTLSLFHKLRFGCGCLHIIRLIWKYSKTKLLCWNQADSKYLQNFVDTNTKFVSEVASLVFNNADMLTSYRETDLSFDEHGGILFNIMSISLDFLSIEISANLQNRIVSDHPLVNALETSFGGSLSKIIETTKNFSLVSSFQSISDCCETLRSDAGNMPSSTPLIDSILNIFANASPVERDDFIVGYHYCDISAAVQWAYELQTGFLSSADSSSAVVHSLGLAYRLFSIEIRCLVSWKTFVQSFHLLLQNMRENGCDNSLLTMPDAAFSSSMVQEILKALSQNLQLSDNAMTGCLHKFLKAEALTITKHCTGLLLTFGQLGEPDMTEAQWISSMDLICKIGANTSKIDQLHPTLVFSTLKQIFAVAIMLSHIKPVKANTYGGTSPTAPFYLGLTIQACTVIRKMEKNSMLPDEYRNCFCTYVAFLTTIINSAAPGSSSFSENEVNRLCEVFQDHGVVRSLVDQATKLSSSTECLHDPGQTRANGNSVKHSLCLPLLTTLDFFTRVAAAALNSTSLLLRNNEATRILWSKGSRPTFQTETMSSIEMKDVAYNISTVPKAKMKFIAACLRSSNQSSTGLRDVSVHFINVAIEFVQVNKELFISCLKKCCTSEGPKEKWLSLDSLNDAYSVLSLIVELCSGSALDSFQREAPVLIQELRTGVLFLIVSLGNFLGASAASRDLFRAADRMSSEDMCGLDQGTYSASLGPDQRLLVGGLQNAKHEAIRYSHFVSKVSKRDFPSFAPSEKGSSETKTMASLENACRLVVTQDFESIESLAAKCLFSALQVFWKSHPSANCFVSFSKEEASQLDAMRLVRPGSVIGFRKTDEKTLFAQNVSSTQDDICFGRVLCCDTIRRQWLVQVEGREHENAIVQDIQLAGVEDMTKRTSLLAYSPAPDSSATIETASISASLGHLILALRWCSQFYSEIHRNGSPCPELRSATVRLAELSVAVLGSELSIADEIRREQNFRQSERGNVIAKQLMDLFVETSDFAGHVVPNAFVVPLQSDRLLKNILDNSTWNAIRDQLREYLNMAATNLMRKTASMNLATEGAPRILQGVMEGNSYDQ